MTTYDQLVQSLSQRPDLVGRAVADVWQLAQFRFEARQHFYRLADRFFALAIFQMIVVQSELIAAWVQKVSGFGFAMAVIMMFWCEFKARTMTRQLKRPAVEQVARDLLGMKG